MGRLRAAPGRLTTAPKALSWAGEVGKAPGVPRVRDLGASLRNLYATKRWRDPEDGVRVRIIARDGGKCRFCHTLLIGPKNAPNSPVVDHRTPHKGNLVLFWDEENLQALCKRCHDTTKQRQDHAAQAQGKGQGWG